jgi:hypothetical protein
MYKKAMETGICFHRGPIGGTWRRDSYTRDLERKVRFFSYQEPLFIWDFKKYEKEGSGSRHLSLHRRPLSRTLGGGLIHWGPPRDRQKKKAVGMVPPPPSLSVCLSVCLEAVRGVPGWRVVLLGTPEDTYKKALEEAIFCHRGLGEPGGLGVYLFIRHFE